MKGRQTQRPISSAMIARNQTQVQNQQYLQQRPPNTRAAYPISAGQVQQPYAGTQAQQYARQQQYPPQQQQQQQQQHQEHIQDGIKIIQKPMTLEQAITDLSLRVLKAENKLIQLDNDPESAEGVDDALIQDIFSRLEIVEKQSKNNPQLLLPPIPQPVVDTQEITHLKTEISTLKKQILLMNQTVKKFSQLETKLNELTTQVNELEFCPIEDPLANNEPILYSSEDAYHNPNEVTEDPIHDDNSEPIFV
jgi:hypothetical protein